MKTISLPCTYYNQHFGTQTEIMQMVHQIPNRSWDIMKVWIKSLWYELDALHGGVIQSAPSGTSSQEGSDPPTTDASGATSGGDETSSEGQNLKRQAEDSMTDEERKWGNTQEEGKEVIRKLRQAEETIAKHRDHCEKTLQREVAEQLLGDRLAVAELEA